MAQAYRNTVDKKVKAILFVIIDEKTEMELETFEFFTVIKNRNVTGVLIPQSDIEKLNRLRIIDILEND